MQPGRNPTGLTYLGTDLSRDPSLGSVLAWYAGHPVGDQHHHLVPVSPRLPHTTWLPREPKPRPAVGLGTWGILLVTSVTIGYPVTRADRGTPNEWPASPHGSISLVNRSGEAGSRLVARSCPGPLSANQSTGHVAWRAQEHEVTGDQGLGHIGVTKHGN